MIALFTLAIALPVALVVVGALVYAYEYLSSRLHPTKPRRSKTYYPAYDDMMADKIITMFERKEEL